MSVGFEGSYLGAAAKISPRAILECKICWTPYDPAHGDETRQIQPGTPFIALPDDWKCPNCDGAKEQFMVLEDPSAGLDAEMDARMAEGVERLVAEFHEIYVGKMRDVPFCNAALIVEAVGFQPWRGHFLGVLISPWFMNLILPPDADDDWSALNVGNKEMFVFPSGPYEFIDMSIGRIGGFKGCSLFSPMAEFKTQEEARRVAEAVMTALFDDNHREETDRSASIRRQRETELAPPEEVPVEIEKAPSRRAVLTGDLATGNIGAGDSAKDHMEP